MLKILIRKQLEEQLSLLLRRGAAGKKKQRTNIILYSVLFLYLFGSMGFLFYTTASSLCAPLVGAGLSWLYFALMGVTATGMGVLGSVFTAYSALYRSRDNDLLLSLPIPPRLVLLSRAATVFFMALLFEIIVWLPVCVVFFLAAPPTVISVVAAALLLLLLPLLSTVLSCILGWVIALISAHVRRPQAVTMVVSLAFLGAYFYASTRISGYLQSILLDPSALAGKVKTVLYPFYHMGLGAAGSLPSLLLFSAMALAAAGAVYTVLSSNFLRLATHRKGSSAKVRHAVAGHAASADAALLRKEFHRFTGSAVYMLNAGLGVIFLLLLPFAAFFKGDELLAPLLALFPGFSELLPLLVCGILASMVSTCPITAPSVSLEGKTLWQLQSLPVTPWQVLRAKLVFHLLAVAPAVLFCAAGLALWLKLSPLSALLIFLFALLFTALCAAFGLSVNLKFPNLDWTSETVAVKQSLSVLIAIFAPWGALVLLGVGCYFLLDLLPIPLILLLLILLTGLLTALLVRWLKTGGSRTLANL